MRVVSDVDDELAKQGAEQLGDDVRQHFIPGEQAVDGLSKGHGRVDMSAGYATEHEHREHDAEAIAHGDVQPAGVVALGVLELDVGHGAVAEDHRKQTWRLYTLPHDEMPAGCDVECPAECNAQKATGISRSDLESQWLRDTGFTSFIVLRRIVFRVVHNGRHFGFWRRSVTSAEPRSRPHTSGREPPERRELQPERQSSIASRLFAGHSARVPRWRSGQGRFAGQAWPCGCVADRHLTDKRRVPRLRRMR